VTQMYRMCDLPTAQSKAAIPVSSPEEAKRWNTPELGFGIFATVNTFNGPRRKENLKRINAWAIDMDEGTKEQMAAKLMAFRAVPSIIVETKRGYQAYWATRDARPECWDHIVLERLVPHFGSDANARDLCRILRVPGFLHLKDPADPFMVKKVWFHRVFYTEFQFVEILREELKFVPSKARHAASLAEARASAGTTGYAPTDSLWDAVWQLDCEEGLLRLSGHWAVSGEQYTFRRTTRGNLNLFVDGKGTSCFVDQSKKIGSLTRGGPTLAQWLRWYGNDWKTVVAVLKETFPHLVDVDEAAKKARR
jgi:hypothetical protein